MRFVGYEEAIATCSKCGLKIGYRELTCEEKPEWRLETCPRCGAPLSVGEGHQDREPRGIDGDCIRRAMRRRRLTLREVAARAGVNASRLSHILSGDGSLTDKQLLQLCDCVGIDPSQAW